MLKISSAQFDTLQADRLHVFCIKLAKRARSRHGDACDPWTDAALIDLFETEVTFARGHDILRTDVLERWADLAIILGFGFGTTLPWVAEILAENTPAPLRLSQIEREAVFAAQEV